MRGYYYGRIDGLNLRPCEADDEHAFTPRADFAAAFMAEGGKLPDGPKWTLWRGREAVLGVGGFELVDGALGAWALMSDLRPREWLAAADLAVGVIRHAWREGKSIRAAPASTPQACRLLRRMGFHYAGNDEDGLSVYQLGEAA